MRNGLPTNARRLEAAPAKLPKTEEPLRWVFTHHMLKNSVFFKGTFLLFVLAVCAIFLTNALSPEETMDNRKIGSIVISVLLGIVLFSYAVVAKMNGWVRQYFYEMDARSIRYILPQHQMTEKEQNSLIGMYLSQDRFSLGAGEEGSCMLSKVTRIKTGKKRIRLVLTDSRFTVRMEAEDRDRILAAILQAIPPAARTTAQASVKGAAR